MSAKRIQNTAKILLLLYVGYFSCVSLFTHTHIYNGIVYIHSHPYKNWAKDKNESKRSPFDTHEHTASTFFTLNQLSNIGSLEATKTYVVGNNSPIISTFTEQLYLQDIIRPVICTSQHRAPPFFFI
ncbi:hypothetical protein [Dysgonomonas sp. Marseille-P4361]|uniref:hypothetical protein n=1 Tax=Dysgonomonas sp. Marseille-P4361 TaxID=2161820 RepID=UPI000D55CE9C|nr:hypothetical protein [Dysgonomonas sp. Marseille-P4361]